MQDQYWEYIRKQIYFAATDKSQILANLVFYEDITVLKKSPNFIAFKDEALKTMELEQIFLEIASICVVYNNLSGLRFLIEDCHLEKLFEYKREDNADLLIMACRYGFGEIILYLLSKGCNPNCVDVDGNTPLHELAANDGQADLVPILVKSGARVDARNKKGQTPLHFAANFGAENFIVALKNAGASVKIKFQNKNYQQIKGDAKKGETIAKRVPSPVINVEAQATNKLMSRFAAAFLASKLNRQAFQDLIRDIINEGGTVKVKSPLKLMDCYFLTSYSDLESIKKILSKHLQKNTIEPYAVYLMAMRVISFLTTVNETRTAVSLIDFILTVLENVQFNKSKLSLAYNEIAVVLNMVGLFSKAEELLKKGLSVTQDNFSVGCLYATLGVAKSSQFNGDCLECYENAFKFIRDDVQIFQNYFHELLKKGQFDKILKASRLSKCTDYAYVVILTTRYHQGTMQPNDILSLSMPVLVEPFAQILWHDLKSICYLRSGDRKQAIDQGKLSLQISEAKPRLLFSSQAQMLVRILSLLINCESYQEALETFNFYQKKYPLEFSSSLLLKCFCAIIYSVNQLNDKAEVLLRELEEKNFHREELANIYISIAISELLSSSKAYEHTIQYLKLALKINPNNERAAFYASLVNALTKKNEPVQETLDKDYVQNLAKENDLLHEDSTLEQELTQEHYDPVKVHKFFQNQKKQLLSNLTESLVEFGPPTDQWQIHDALTDKVGCKILNFNSKFYPNHFATIGPNLPIAPEVFNRFEQALSKGICKRNYEQNGIKIINGCVAELKINDDIRLYTTRMYKNSLGQSLFIFDTVGNHSIIQRLVRENKPIEIITLPEIHSAIEAYPGTFLRNNSSAQSYELASSVTRSADFKS